MVSNSRPTVSIIIVNFNGWHYLDPCLASILRLAVKDFEVICIDNCSTDESIASLSKYYPWVKVIRAERNLGFAGGNNLGIRNAQGDYIVLLNNDTIVDAHWLEKLIEVAKSNEKIGAIGSKILFYRKFLPVIFSSSTFSPKLRGFSSDPRRLGFRLMNNISIAGEEYKKVFYDAGFYGIEYDPENNCHFQWTSGVAKVFVPFSESSAEYILEFYAACQKNEEKYVDILIGDYNVSRFIVGPDFQKFSIPLDRGTIDSHGIDIINNAGSYLLPYGIAGDIGFGEVDHGQFDQIQEKSNLCGCSVLINRKMLDEIGLFYEKLFMYFEDTDLFWRASKKKWKLVYCPASVVRHHHAGSSKEWSPFFTFYVHRNRFLIVLKNGSFREALLTGCSLIVPLIQETRNIIRTMLMTRSIFHCSWVKLIAILKAIFSSVFHIIPVLFTRFAKR